MSKLEVPLGNAAPYTNTDTQIRRHADTQTPTHTQTRVVEEGTNFCLLTTQSCLVTTPRHSGAPALRAAVLLSRRSARNHDPVSQAPTAPTAETEPGRGPASRARPASTLSLAPRPVRRRSLRRSPRLLRGPQVGRNCSRARRGGGRVCVECIGVNATAGKDAPAPPLGLPRCGEVLASWGLLRARALACAWARAGRWPVLLD